MLDALLSRTFALTGRNLTEECLKMLSSVHLFMTLGSAACCRLSSSQKIAAHTYNKREYWRKRRQLQTPAVSILNLPADPMILKQRHPQVYSSAFQADEELVHCKIPLAQLYLVDSSYFCRGNGGPAPALAMPFGGNLDPMQQLQMQMQQMQDQFLMRQGQQSQAPGGNRLKSLANLQNASRLPWWTRKASAELGAAGDTRRLADVLCL